MSRNFLLSLYHKTPELAIYSYSLPTQCSLMNNTEHSLLPCDSPIELTVTANRFLNGRVLLNLRTVHHLPTGASKVILSTPKECIEVDLDSTVVEIAAAPPGEIHFEVVGDSGSSMGKGKYKVRVDCGWVRVDWLTVGGLKIKAAWEGRGFTARYLGLYWGEPVCVGFEEGSTDVTIYTCSKNIIESILEDLQEMLDNLTEGTLQIKY